MTVFFQAEHLYQIATPHTRKPDLTNILKGVEDALIRLDQQVAWHKTAKLWGPDDRVEIILHDVEYE